MSDGTRSEDGAGGTRDTATTENEAPVTKKLRSCEPDLKISIGRDNEIRWYHSAIIANHSTYVDTMLAAPMKESQTKHISFPEIEPNVWDSMLKFVQDPLEAREMTVKDAMSIAKEYDKYDFDEGRRLCARVLEDFIVKSEKNKPQTSTDADLIVDAIVVAFEANLDVAKEAGVKFLKAKMSVLAPWLRTMFTEVHMTKLVPILIEMKSKSSNFTGWTKDELHSPLFSRLFVENQRKWEAHNTLYSELDHITVSGSLCAADGKYDWDGVDMYVFYHCGPTSSWGGVEVKFRIGLLKDNWVIYGETLSVLDEDGEEDYDSDVETIYWESPCSGNLALPPKRNWRPVDKLARGNPTIKYTFR